MKHILYAIIIVSFSLCSLNAQNVGQKTDSIVNYTDINGLKQGRWTKVFVNHQTAYEAYFVNNKLLGDYKRYYENGKLNMEVSYDNNESGYVKIYYDDGVLASEGQYVQRNLKDGLWKFYNLTGRKIIEAHFKNGVLHGEEIKYWQNGQKLEKKIWENGKMVGVWSRYFSNSKTRFQIQYEDGERTGKILMYHPNGQPQLEGSYKKNIRHGHWVYYDQQGNILRNTHFVNGVANDEDEIEIGMRKKMEEWDKMKGLIPDPDEENMFHYDREYGPLSK